MQDLVGPDLEWVLISNYMIDMDWLLSLCPNLCHAKKMIVVHGEKRLGRWVTHGVDVACSFYGLAELPWTPLDVLHLAAQPFAFMRTQLSVLLSILLDGL